MQKPTLRMENIGGKVRYAMDHPIAMGIGVTVAIMVFIIVAGVLMRVVKYVVIEYKGLKNALNIPTQVDRVPVA